MISYDIFSNIAILSALPLNKLPFYLLKVQAAYRIDCPILHLFDFQSFAPS